MRIKMRITCSIVLLVVFALPLTCFAAYDRGLVNESLNDGPSFYDRYDYDEYIPLGSLASTSYTQGWTFATLFVTAGGEGYTIVNCNEYVNARAEADSSSKSLQRFYRGSTVCVVGLWRDWALCICDEYNEQNYVCGWVNQKYLQPSGDSAYDYYDLNDSSTPYTDYSDSNNLDGTGAYVGDRYVVNCKDWVSLRLYPNTTSDRMAKVPLGAKVEECYEAENGFYYCSYNGTWGYIQNKYLSSNPPTTTKPVTSNNDNRYDLNQYEYLPVVERGRGALVFQKSPRGSFMKKHKFYDGDYIYVNVNWRQNGYAIAYEDGEYGYVDASYIDW